METSKERRVRLEDARNLYQFLQDYEDEEGWLIEKQRICQTGVSAKDLRAVLSLQQKHKVIKLAEENPFYLFFLFNGPTSTLGQHRTKK